MELKKGQKQGRDERTQEDYRISAVYFCRCPVGKEGRTHVDYRISAAYFCRCPVVFLRSFISAYRTSAKIRSRYRVVFLRFFISAFFLSFFLASSILEWSKVLHKFFPPSCIYNLHGIVWQHCHLCRPRLTWTPPDIVYGMYVASPSTCDNCMGSTYTHHSVLPHLYLDNTSVLDQ